MLHEFVTANRAELINRCRIKVAARPVPPPTQAEIDHGVPMFLDQLVTELRFGPSPNPEITRTSIQHGRDLLRQGYTISQLVHGYGDVCQSVTELAIQHQAGITASDFRALNRCLDDAIAGSVTEYANQRQTSIDLSAEQDKERRSALAHEVRVCLEATRLASDTVLSGVVGIAGGTARLLDDNLTRAQVLIERLIAAL
jgi:hypothetical protein